jgi:hypothetical protein
LKRFPTNIKVRSRDSIFWQKILTFYVKNLYFLTCTF